MIIDIILDRKGDREAGFTGYDPMNFYEEIVSYEKIFQPGWGIADAMDTNENYNVQKALCGYILNNEYNIEIMRFILDSDWLTPSK